MLESLSAPPKKHVQICTMPSDDLALLGATASADTVMTKFRPHVYTGLTLNTLRPRQNGRLFADDTFKRIFFKESIIISIKISLKFVPKGLINNIPALVLIMAWRRPGDKPLSEPMLVRSLTHICVTQPRWVKMVNKCKYSYRQKW